jgi:hypothetical protein
MQQPGWRSQTGRGQGCTVALPPHHAAVPVAAKYDYGDDKYSGLVRAEVGALRGARGRPVGGVLRGDDLWQKNKQWARSAT